MAYCPFSLVKEVVKERKVTEGGKVAKEGKETTTFHLMECLREKCEVFDLGAQKCSLPILANRLQSIEEVEGRTRQATSDLSEATSTLLADLVESSSGILTESKGTKELVTKLIEAGPAPGGGGGLPAGLAENLAKLVRALEDGRNASVETALETRVLLEKITQALADFKPVQGGGGLDPESKAALTEIRNTLLQSSQGMDHAMSLLPDAFKESQGAMLEAYRKEAGDLKASLDSLSGAQKAQTVEVSGTLKANADSLSKSLEDLPKRISVAQGPLFTKFAEENKAAFDLFVQNVTETTLSLTQLRQTSERANEILSAMSAATSDALRLNAEAVSASLEKEGQAANEKRAAVQAGLAENRQALEKLLSATEESTRPLNTTLQEVGGKLEGLLSAMERQNALLSNSFETLGQRVASLGDGERRSTEALLAALTENQKAQSGALDSFRTALEKSAEATHEALTGPKDREAVLDRISGDIAASTQVLGSFLEAQRTIHEEERRKLKSEESKLHNDRGVSLFYQQAYGAAEMEFKRALELAPDMVEGYNNLALVLSETDKNEEAALCFQRAIELSPDFAEALNNLGCLYERMGEHARAVEIFQAALSKRADYAGAYANLGTAYHALNKLDEAAKAWERSLTLDPANEKVKKKLSLLKGA
jgi:tetratricopeptide (TPR) repeat protein